MPGAEWGWDQPCRLGRHITWARLSLVGAQRQWKCDLRCVPAHAPVPICARVRGQNETNNAWLWSTEPVDSGSVSAGPRVSGFPHSEALTREAKVRPGPQPTVPGTPFGLLVRGWPEWDLYQPLYEPPPPVSPEPLLVSVGNSSGRERVSQDTFNPCSPELG